MKTINQLIVVLIITLCAATSCSKNDDIQLWDTNPTMTNIAITGNGLIYEITISFNNGVYSSKNKSGDLDQNSFLIFIKNSDVVIESYTITHAASQKNAKIRLAFNTIPSDNVIITIHPSTNLCIYNFEGIAMSISESLSVRIGDN